MQRWVDRVGLSSNVLTALLLLAMTVAAWLATVRADSTMQMGQGVELVSLEAGAAYVLQWGVMMAAMMLPSATPMILLYKAVSRGPAAREERVISAESFALVYLVLWLLTGIPVYLASTAVTALTLRSTAVASAIPYMVAGTLIAAGLYQLSSLKRACLRECDAPMNFLMRRWRGGHAASLRLAATHAAYCIGCCWALMVVLVAAGAMSLKWVLAISLAVFAEKVLPRGERTARVIGVSLIAAGVAVAARPELAAMLKPHGMH